MLKFPAQVLCVTCAQPSGKPVAIQPNFSTGCILSKAIVHNTEGFPTNFAQFIYSIFRSIFCAITPVFARVFHTIHSTYNKVLQRKENNLLV